MLFFRMLLGFSPWIAFALIAPGSLPRLKLGLAVALALSIGLALARLSRGALLWAGLAFFAANLVAVGLFETMWAVRNMHALANGALALAVWTGILLGRPFPLEYAPAAAPDRDNTPWPQRAYSLMAALWAMAFSVNAGLAFLRTARPETPLDGLAAFSRGLQLSATLTSLGLPLALTLLRKGQDRGRGSAPAPPPGA